MSKPTARFARRVVLGTLGATGLVLGAGAAITLASGSATITACVSHHGGALYRSAHCRRHDQRLTWGVQGPRGVSGPAGARGPAGPAGATGAAGPAGATGQGPAFGVFDGGGINSSDGNFHTVVTLSIPAGGSYALFGKVEANNAGTQVMPECQLVAESDFDQSDAVLSTTGPAVTLPLEVIHTYAGPGTATLQCNARGVATHFGFAKIIAERMSSVVWHVSS